MVGPRRITNNPDRCPTLARPGGGTDPPHAGLSKLMTPLPSLCLYFSCQTFLYSRLVRHHPLIAGRCSHLDKLQILVRTVQARAPAHGYTLLLTSCFLPCKIHRVSLPSCVTSSHCRLAETNCGAAQCSGPRAPTGCLLPAVRWPAVLSDRPAWAAQLLGLAWALQALLCVESNPTLILSLPSSLAGDIGEL